MGELEALEGAPLLGGLKPSVASPDFGLPSTPALIDALEKEKARTSGVRGEPRGALPNESTRLRPNALGFTFTFTGFDWPEEYLLDLLPNERTLRSVGAALSDAGAVHAVPSSGARACESGARIADAAAAAVDDAIAPNPLAAGVGGAVEAVGAARAAGIGGAVEAEGAARAAGTGGAVEAVGAARAAGAIVKTAVAAGGDMDAVGSRAGAGMKSRAGEGIKSAAGEGTKSAAASAACAVSDGMTPALGAGEQPGVMGAASDGMKPGG